MKVIDNDTYDVSNITFDSNKNIYVLTINGIYKCPAKQKEFKKAFLPLCTILILSHKCWEKPIYGLLPTFLNQT
ncbi:hypothetical protein [Spiroplasma endosymbiont of Apeira syringaria]|uniref:hypothetical protein n=1 Tax=Spiroplasma endosymbiont of Apeira syringaria TaxID=3066307 RepID=UPI0030CBADB4